MKLKVCFKDYYPCRPETCGEYDVCKVRLEKEKMTNDEWRQTCSAEEFAKWLENKLAWAAREQGFMSAKFWADWLKEKHTDD